MSTTFFGSIGFCRNEALEVGVNGEKMLFSFSVLAKKSFYVGIISVLPVEGACARSQDSKDPAGGKSCSGSQWTPN